jgi:hypothetical protein
VLFSNVPACRKRSFYDQEARTLRGQLRAAYESLLFLDAAFAAANDVELLLWKSVFYRPIEEFRSRLKQADKVRWGLLFQAAGAVVACFALSRFQVLEFLFCSVQVSGCWSCLLCGIQNKQQAKEAR